MTSMNPTIPAIFSAGVFRPLVPVEMAEGTRVEMEVSTNTPSPIAMTDIQASWQDYLKQMEALPDDSPQDGLSNRDHDQILCGE